MKISDLPNLATVADTDLVVVVDTADFTEAPTGTTKHALVSAVRSGIAPRLDASFQGEVTGTSATMIGAIYLPAITLAATSRVLAGVVGAGTATIRLVQQSTATVVATWTTSSAIGDVTLGAPTAALAAGWYTFDLAGSGAGTVTRCYGAYLES